MANKTSQHILETSANLIGFCLFIITSLHMSINNQNSQIYEFTTIIGIFLTISSFYLFISILTENKKQEKKFEKIEDYLFIISLIGILSIIVLRLINLWNK